MTSSAPAATAAPPAAAAPPAMAEVEAVQDRVTVGMQSSGYARQLAATPVDAPLVVTAAAAATAPPGAAASRTPAKPGLRLWFGSGKDKDASAKPPRRRILSFGRSGRSGA